MTLSKILLRMSSFLVSLGQRLEALVDSRATRRAEKALKQLANMQQQLELLQQRINEARRARATNGE
jgi:hypothetical protein